MTDPDPADLLTTTEAAALVGRTPATIRSWQHRGALPTAGTTPSRQGSPANTYRRSDVLAAAAAAGATNNQRTPHRVLSGDAWDPSRRLLTVTEAAATVDVDARTLTRWIEHGYLRVQRGDRLLFLEVDVLDAAVAARRADPRYRGRG